MADGPFGDLQPAGDFLVGEPLGEAQQDFRLSLRQAQLHERVDAGQVVQGLVGGGPGLLACIAQAQDQVSTTVR